MRFVSDRFALRSRPFAVLLFLFVLFALALAGPGTAQEVDVTGTWILDVTTGQGGGTPTVTLEQEGDSLSGHYSSSNLGEADLRGSVRGSDVRFTLQTAVQGQPVTVTYEGTVRGDDSMEGSIDLGGLVQGTFTGRRR